MKRLVVLTVVVIAIFTGGLALYLFWVGTLLNRIAANLDDSAELVSKIDDHATAIRPGVAHINGPAVSWPELCRCCTGWRSRSFVT